MTIVTKDIYKIDWFTWDGSDSLIIQSRALNVDEEETMVEDMDGYFYPSVQLIRIDFKGSVKFTFNGIDTQEKVDAIIDDVQNGVLK
jgi:hypothetical protein